MNPVHKTISACRHCRFYQSEGRRGGSCQQLEVPVQASWKACSLAMAPFASKWDHLSEIASRQLASPDPQEVLPQVVMSIERGLQKLLLPEADLIPATVPAPAALPVPVTLPGVEATEEYC